MRLCPVHALLLGLLVLPCQFAFATDETGQPSRFTLTAELRPLAVSACGRFTLDATARYTPEARSTGGRFALKAVNEPAGGCDPYPGPLFSNGFESP